LKKDVDVARATKRGQEAEILFPPTQLEAVFGSLPYAGPAKTVEEMNPAPGCMIEQMNAALDAIEPAPKPFSREAARRVFKR
jgi:hypothetical protein